ncbi:MAG: tRNA (adenosine(37)-N6)-threonylcarbamoyltransferase complex dimerization subunit type 1 TsaB [Bacteroidales bacterium]|nr:tRNA (adenosine(37)-N6)-threonylcarbamoyltransferase complex dimerization subunit type 1 TsaB [Bacteroidales bacterium]MDD4669906.1 tRNA (adenosine(37)-N6)-threonylcarbamoyltransferase complex dimerization subunit type 1 TsaB [Bacteroidales bacterium]
MNKSTLLLIETSTESCSVAVARGEEVLFQKFTSIPKQHAAHLAPFIVEVLKTTGLSIDDCDAIAVSEGPGSYTGLRVGVSTAKGLCFGAGKPLIAVGTLQILAMQGKGKADTIVSMIDAGRMEVYSALFDKNATQTSDTEATILDENSFADILSTGKVLFIGNGVDKFKAIINHPNAMFESCTPQAAGMVIPALHSMKQKEFKDVAYFEPFYLKEFVAGISKKSLL